MSKKIIAYKGFSKQLTCRDFQFEVGKTYTYKGDIKACQGGFHACEHPLNVFDYYAPGISRYALVELSGRTDKDGADTKVCASTITVKAELDIAHLVDAAVKFTFAAANWLNKSKAKTRKGAASATGDRGAASATGRQGAASATGGQSAALATGRQGAASATGSWGAALATGEQSAVLATGSWGAASATGNWGAASATGKWGAASATGKWGAASATGRQGKAMGTEGSALFLVERNAELDIVNVWSGIVGRDGVEPDTWYTLTDGQLVEAA